jgi:metallo-beta-lactamase class B
VLTGVALFALCLAPLRAPAGELVPDAPLRCDSCEGWNTPHEPFRVFGNTFYVGTAQLASILVVTDAGLVLIDGALPQSAPLIAAHLATLGYRLDDVKLILNSHTHNDHAERGKRGETDAFVDAAGCRNYAAGASQRLEKRLREEQP